MRILTRRDTGLLTQWTFGRSVYQDETIAFITATGISDAATINAINALIVALKGYGIWTKIYALYPFVGGTASTHKFNLKDPRDDNSAYRLIFTGGWTHSSNGALPNGTNAYANTFFIPLSNLTTTSGHQSSYLRTSLAIGVAGAQGCDFTTTNRMLFYPYTYALGYISDVYDGTTSRLITSTGSSQGFIISTRSASNSHKIFRNGTSIASTTAASAGIVPNLTYFIAAINSSGSPAFYCANQLALQSLGLGLTDTEAANYNTAVTAFQTSLSRNV